MLVTVIYDNPNTDRKVLYYYIDFQINIEKNINGIYNSPKCIIFIQSNIQILQSKHLFIIKTKVNVVITSIKIFCFVNFDG